MPERRTGFLFKYTDDCMFFFKQLKRNSFVLYSLLYFFIATAYIQLPRAPNTLVISIGRTFSRWSSINLFVLLYRRRSDFLYIECVAIIIHRHRKLLILISFFYFFFFSISIYNTSLCCRFYMRTRKYTQEYIPSILLFRF